MSHVLQMVVPKRAALLLDRLMVALHRALEKEKNGSARLSDFYNNKNSYNDYNKNSAKDDSMRMRDDDDVAEIPQDVKGDNN